MKLSISRRADCELDRIQDYHERKTGSSERLVALFDDAFAHLRNWPRSGHHRLNLLSGDYLFWLAAPYLIVYTLLPGEVLVVTVLHSSQDLGKALEPFR